VRSVIRVRDRIVDAFDGVSLGEFVDQMFVVNGDDLNAAECGGSDRVFQEVFAFHELVITTAENAPLANEQDYRAREKDGG